MELVLQQHSMTQCAILWIKAAASILCRQMQRRQNNRQRERTLSVLYRQIQNRQNNAEKQQIKIEVQTAACDHHTLIKRADKTPTQTNDNTSKKLYWTNTEVCTSQDIGWEDRLRNDLSVERDVEPYSTHLNLTLRPTCACNTQKKYLNTISWFWINVKLVLGPSGLESWLGEQFRTVIYWY